MKWLFSKLLLGFIINYMAILLLYGIMFLFGARLDLKIFLLAAFVPALIMAVIEFFMIRRKGYSINEKAILEIEKDQIEKIDVLAAKQGWKKREKNNRIIYETPNSYFSFGEKITVTKNADKAVVKSKPLWKTTVFDYGANLDNIYMLRKHLV